MTAGAAGTGHGRDPRRRRERDSVITITDFHADPADRIIVATALGGHRLVTADERILAWSGNLDRLDART